MELNELLKMISSIPERKSKCRGNLRLKVLLKTTYDYARRSWIDGQFGKPQKLQTLLKNSMFNQSSTPSSDNSSLSRDTEAAASLESTEKFNPQAEQFNDTPVNTVSDDILRSDLSLEDEDINDNENKLKKTEEMRENLPELQKVMKKLLKNCNMLIGINDRSRRSIPDYHLNLRKLKRIIHLSRIARVHLERDCENQDFGQQKINRKALKLIRYLLKQCKTLLKVDYNSKVDHHKLKKIIRKLKKFESCAEKIIAYEKFCEKSKNDLDSLRHVDKIDPSKQTEVFNESKYSSVENNNSDSNKDCHFKEISSSTVNLIQSSDVSSSNSQKSESETISRKRSHDKSDLEEYIRERKNYLKEMLLHMRFHRAVVHSQRLVQIQRSTINHIQSSDVNSTKSLKSESETLSHKRSHGKSDFEECFRERKDYYKKIFHMRFHRTIIRRQRRTRQKIFS